MALTKEHLRAVMSGTLENRIENLCQILGYPIKEFDREGSRFWYLRPGKRVRCGGSLRCSTSRESKEDASDTCPIAVSFYAELNESSDRDIRQFLTAPEQQNEIYGHYIRRVATEQPVMYLLLPEAELQGRVVLILPTEGGLQQRQIQIFEWCDRELLGRLSRLQQGTLRIADRLTALIPQVDWVFYPGVKTAEKLAQLMAEVARRIEQAIPSVYAGEKAGGYLHKLFESFKKELLPTLKLQADNEKDYSFVDIYAQTVAYGLFTARVFGFLKFKREKNPNDLEPDFYRDNAWEFLPETNPFLRKLFEDISKQPPEDLGEDLVSAVSELLSVLRAAEMEAVLSDFEQKIGQEDIIIRFYEDFLKAYKPQMRERRGVYYTPEPVVSYMVRSVDILLKEKFNKPLGLADPEVMILDPACGTGTFLLWICQLIYQRFQESPEALTEGLIDKSWSGYVKERLLPRIFGFELLMAPYAIAHLKLSLFLEETGYQFDSGKRLGVYLTNTLDEATKKTEVLFEEFIANEADEASEIKRSLPIMAVIGNPPYSANSVNNSKWATNLVKESYYPRDEIKEQNPKLLLDDYVKFIRAAQWRIEKTGYGILSFISNHGYLDNPTFRGMRQSLMKTFDQIYALDLHGNVKKKEQSPDGSVDKNVFDIQQGVSLGIFAKLPTQSEPITNVRHTHLWGTRKVKNDWLNLNSINSTNWSKLTPKLPFSLFVPQNSDLLPEYEQGWKITDIMTVNSTGVKTHRDHFVIDFDADKLRSRIAEFRNLKISDSVIAAKYSLSETTDWKINLRRRSLAANEEWEKYVTKCLYRPFDTRAYYHHPDVVERPRNEVMKHMLTGENVAFICSRQQSQQGLWGLVSVARDLVECCAISNKTKETNYLLPLYSNSRTDVERAMGIEKRPNLSQHFLNDITSKLGYTPTPEAIFYYIYAIFHSPTYRTRYAEFLKIDFPRVPLTSSDRLFRQLAAYGEELVALHLMKSPKLDNTITQYCDRGGNRVVDAGHPKFICHSEQREESRSFAPQSSAQDDINSGDVIINKKGDRFKSSAQDDINSGDVIINKKGNRFKSSAQDDINSGDVIINKKGDLISGVPENVWNFYVGGYQVCQKWLKDRKGRTLSDEDILHYQRIVVALQETIELMAKIDAAIPSFPVQ